jgi:hypothetical protein
MYNDPGADQPVSALENANGFHIELNENALEHVSRFYQPSVNTGSPTFFEYPLSSPFWLRVQCNGYSTVCSNPVSNIAPTTALAQSQRRNAF